MNAFLKTHRLALTPLSPIHIGCGEDFEPTNYVIVDGVLYGFDHSRAVLNDAQRAKLSEAGNRASLLGIQRFFRENAQFFKVHADVLMPVSKGIADKYERDVGRAVNIEANGNSVFNLFFIERCSYTGERSVSYIPGSSFKGAIRTAWIDDLNDGKIPQDIQYKFNGEAKSSTGLENRLVGDYKTSLLRLLKVADLMPAPQCDPARGVLYAVNLKKKEVIKDGIEVTPKGIATRKECILHGQYRAFVADAVLPLLGDHVDPKNTPAPDLRPTNFRNIARQANAYNLTRLKRELALLDGRGLVNPSWKQSIEKLLAGDLKAKLSNGDAFLIRLGRYGGADNKTLSGEGVAQIKIMGARGQKPTFESTTKTVWLAAENESERKHLLPFGWALVEIDPGEQEFGQLKSWCESQSSGRPDMGQLRKQFELEKARDLQRKSELAAEAATRELNRLAEIQMLEKRAEELARMSPQARSIEEWRQICQDLEAKIVGGNFKKQNYSAGNPGPIYQEAAKLVRMALESGEWSSNDKAALADTLEQWMPKVITPWDAKDQRKKLKLAALRGTN